MLSRMEEWITAEVPQYQVLEIEVHLQRRSFFYSVFLLFPTVILYLLSGLLFLLPVDSGEKVSFIVTILLAQCVIFGSLIDILPTTSLTLPYMAYLVLFVIFHLAILCIAAILGAFHDISCDMIPVLSISRLVVNVRHRKDNPKKGRFVRRVISSKYLVLIGMEPIVDEGPETGKCDVGSSKVAPLEMSNFKKEVTDDVMAFSTSGETSSDKPGSVASPMDTWLCFARVLLIVHLILVLTILLSFNYKVK